MLVLLCRLLLNEMRVVAAVKKENRIQPDQVFPLEMKRTHVRARRYGKHIFGLGHFNFLREKKHCVCVCVCTCVLVSVCVRE